MGLLNRFLCKINGLVKEKAKKQVDIKATANIMPNFSHYHGASFTDTRVRSWYAPQTGPNYEFSEAEQNVLIARSRDLYRNFPLVTAAVNRLVDSAIGTGIKFQPRLRFEDFPEYTTEELVKISRKIKEDFTVWAETCGADSRFSFWELQRQILFSLIVGGDCFWNSVFVKDKLRIQIFEPEQVSSPMGEMETRKMRRGLAFDDFGENQGFFIQKEHPADGLLENSFDWEFVPRFGKHSDIVRAGHVADLKRPGQIRGVPLIAPVLITCKELSDYFASEQTSAKIASFFTVFIKKQTSSGGFPFQSEVDKASESLKPYIPSLAPGAIIELLENEDISVADPKRPSPQFEKYVSTVSIFICATLGVPYELVVMSFQSSYSASRASFLAFCSTIDFWREILESKFLWAVLEIWLRDWLYTHNFINDFSSEEAEKWMQGAWIPPITRSIEPNKDIEAALQRVEAGFSTTQREAEQLTGEDINDLRSQEAGNA